MQAIMLWTTILVIFGGYVVIGMKLDTGCMNEDYLTTLPSEEEMVAVMRGERDFSVHLIKSLFYDFNATGNHGNIFISPSSIYELLMLSYFGAAGTTESELSDILGLGDQSKDGIRRAYLMERTLQAAREKDPELTYDLTHVNKLFFDHKLPLSSCMQFLLHSELTPVDFSKPEKTRQIINKLVEEKTRNNIKNLIPEGAFEPDNTVALVNAAYFKGLWQSQFHIDNTKRDNFYIRQDKITTTNFMKQEGNFHYYVSEELRSHVLKLPYQGEDISMVIILPPFEDDGLYSTVQRLTPDILQSVLAEVRFNFYEIQDLSVELPRFSIEQNFDLSATLKKLGVNSLFGDNSDLSEFLEKEEASVDEEAAPRIRVNTALHKSFIEVNEEGSEAAAATAIFALRSAGPHHHTNFVANHPFLFLIVDDKTDLVLFFGVYQDPKK